MVLPCLKRTCNLIWSSQAAHQAAQEKKAEVKEVSPVAALPPAAEAAPESPSKKLPVGSAVSSIHVNYDYFAVGTGQVNVFVFHLDLSLCVFKNQNERLVCSAGVGCVPLSGIRASEFLCPGLSDWHVPDGPGSWKDWRELSAAHMQRILQHIPSGMKAFEPVYLQKPLSLV